MEWETKGGFFVYFTTEKKQAKHLYLKYTATFIIVALFVYSTFWITGHSLIWYIDGANQHLPLLESFRSNVLQFLHHPTLHTWSYHLGLGNDKFQIYSYYLLGGIFAYLSLLFPASKIIFAYQLMIILRLYCAGLAFCWCAKHFKLKQISILTGSLIYLFNAFLLYSNVSQPFFTLPFIIFPILIVNLERVIQGKSSWPLMLTFTWMLVNNFYFAYILGIGALIYLGLRLFWSRHTKRNYGKLLLKLSWSTLLAILNAAVLLLPEIIAVQNSTRAGSKFANGLHFYPAYYYLNLPGQLINGGNRDFYFWSALGFASLTFFGISYTLIHFKKYPIINSSFILGFVMLLIPACAAFFNGFMAPSNRWTLMLCLPIALSCTLLVENLPQLSTHTLKILGIAAGIYLGYLALDYFFQNNEKLFVPVIFLMITLFGIFLIVKFHVKHSRAILFGITLLNVILNAIYFEAPYNGGYAEEMLPNGSYEKLVAAQYGNLTSNLNSQNAYRTSTISQNQVFGNDYRYYNNINPKVNDISSYYSLQNQYLGKFANELQNSQFEANFPIRQFNDRSVINNFFGVKYLFVQSKQPNAAKIPFSYELNKVDWQNTYDNNELLRYRSKDNFPLVYWQDKVFSPEQYSKFGPTQKERALADGVLVNVHTKLPKASVKNQVISLPFKLISSNGNQINPDKIEQLDPNENYQIVIDQSKLSITEKKALKNCELHLEFQNIKYQPLKLMQQVKLQQSAADYQLTSGILTQDQALNSYKYWRNNIVNGRPNTGFTIEVQTSLGKEQLKQPKPYILSFFKEVKNGTLNLGYFPRQIPQQIQLNLKELGTYSFKLKVVAEPLGKAYQQQVDTIQRHALKNAHYTASGFSGQINTDRSGILTSSIPYSKGWTATVDGQKQNIIRTNQAFLGLKLNPGKHQIRFEYHTPGLTLGFKITLCGLCLTLLSAICCLIKIKR